MKIILYLLFNLLLIYLSLPSSRADNEADFYLCDKNDLPFDTWISKVGKNIHQFNLF